MHLKKNKAQRNTKTHLLSLMLLAFSFLFVGLGISPVKSYAATQLNYTSQAEVDKAASSSCNNSPADESINCVKGFNQAVKWYQEGSSDPLGYKTEFCAPDSNAYEPDIKACEDGWNKAEIKLKASPPPSYSIRLYCSAFDSLAAPLTSASLASIDSSMTSCVQGYQESLKAQGGVSVQTELGFCVPPMVKNSCRSGWEQAVTNNTPDPKPVDPLFAICKTVATDNKIDNKACSSKNINLARNKAAANCKPAFPDTNSAEYQACVIAQATNYFNAAAKKHQTVGDFTKSLASVVKKSKPVKASGSGSGSPNSGTSSNGTSIDPGGLPNQKIIDSKAIASILGIVFGIIGALAFLVIVIAGLRYITAAGDPQKTAQAKSTILYALVGLALAITAQAIVAFVVNRV